MKTRFALMGVGALASILAACGGGSGGGPMPTSGPTAKSTATPTPTPTPTIPPNTNGCVGVQSIGKRVIAPQFVGVHPVANGNSYAYSGMLSQVIVRSSPCPMPTATSNASISLVVTVGTPQPSATGSSFTEHSVETDAFAQDTHVLTTDAVVQSVTSGAATLFEELSEVAVDQGGNKITTSYGANGMQYAQLPEAASNSWVNAEPVSVNEALSDGSTYNRAYANTADGSYAETDTIAGVTNTIAVHSDGSGTYTIGANTTQTITVNAAAPLGGNITLTITGLSSSPITRTVQSWLPAPPLRSDTTQDKGIQPLSASCGQLSSLSSPTSAEEFVRTTITADPALGYSDTRTVTTWDLASFGASGKTTGPICAVIADTQNIFYDYTFLTPFFLAISKNAVPIQVTTINETLAMNATPVNNAVGGASPVSAQLTAHLAGITFARAFARARRIEAFVQASRMVRQGGVR